MFTTPRTGLTATDRIYGFRINHHLEVQVDNFGVSKARSSAQSWRAQ